MNKKEIVMRIAISLTAIAGMGPLPGCNNNEVVGKPLKLEDIPPALRPAPMPEPKSLILNEITFNTPASTQK